MTKAYHSVMSENGYTIWLPPNIQDVGLIDLHVPEPTEIFGEATNKRYPFGTKLTADDRVWKHSYAGAVIASGTQRGCANANKHIEGGCIGTAAAGAYAVNWRISDTDYPAIGYTTVNRYEGGYLWLMHTARFVLYKIISNLAATGETAGTDYVTLTLEQPLSIAVDTTWGTAYPNIYSDCRADYPNEPTAQQAVVCVAWDGVTAERYFWGQTWGPVWITGHGGSLGNTANERQVVFHAGLMRLANSGHEYKQNCGFILSDNHYTDDCLIMLQISP